MEWLLDKKLNSSFYDKGKKEEKKYRRDLNGNQCLKFLKYIDEMDVQKGDENWIGSEIQLPAWFLEIRSICQAFEKFLSSTCSNVLNRSLDRVWNDCRVERWRYDCLYLMEKFKESAKKGIFPISPLLHSMVHILEFLDENFTVGRGLGKFSLL